MIITQLIVNIYLPRNRNPTIALADMLQIRIFRAMIRQTSLFFESNLATLVLLGVFFLSALVAAFLVKLLQNQIFGQHSAGIFRIYLLSLLGGLLGAGLIFVISISIRLQTDTHGSSLYPFIGLLFLLLFLNMLVIPLVALVFRRKNLKIKMLEEELRNRSPDEKSE